MKRMVHPYTNQWVQCQRCKVTFNVQHLPGLDNKLCEVPNCKNTYRHAEVGSNRVMAMYIDPLAAEALEPVPRPNIYTDYGTPPRSKKRA